MTEVGAEIVQAEAEEHLLAAMMRRLLTDEDLWAVVDGNDIHMDGWLRLTSHESALARRITRERSGYERG